jgi:hypothetical protein
MPEQGGAVEVRAFRGTRRASVYREHVLPEEDFGRILAAGTARGLTLLSSLPPHGPREIDKASAKRLAEEATALRISGELPDLDGDLTAVIEVARWCAHASDDSWLRIEGR